MVNWTAEKDQTILRGIFKFHDIKNSQPFLDFLAKEIGEGCTPKAVSHRLTNLRKCGKPVNSGGSSSVKKMTATSRIARTPAAARGFVKANKSTKIAEDAMFDDDDDDSEPVASPSVSRKRARNSAPRKSYVESDADTGEDEDEFTPLSKMVKPEPVEEEQGIGYFAGDDDLIDEEDEAVAFV